MSDELNKKDFDVTELEDSALDAVAGGMSAVDVGVLPDIDALGCKDNGNCPQCTTNSGNCVAGCT